MSSVSITPGVGKDISTEEVAGEHFQRVKVALLVDGVPIDVSESNPLPVVGTFYPATQPVSGNFYQALQPVEVQGDVSVVGAVAVSNFPATQAISAATLPLPAGAATEASTAAMLARLPALGTTVPDNTASGTPTRLIGEDITVARFAGVGSSLLSPQMQMVSAVGAGQTVTQAAGSLLIASGTTANASTLIRSVQSWRGAWRLNVRTILSQRIANNNFAVIMGDLVGENLAVTINSATSITVALPGHTFTAQNVGQFMFIGGTALANCPDGRYAIASVVAGVSITFTVAGWPASGSTTSTLFGHHHAKLLYNGTTATAAAWATQATGWANADATLALNTSASPGHIVTIDQEGRRMYVSDTLSASSATPNHANRGSSEENIPDDNVDMYLFLWVYNGTSAPATTTTWTVGFWSVEKYANIPVMIQGVAPQGGAAPMPVMFQSAQPISGSVTATGVAGAGAHSAAASGNPVQTGGVVATAVSTAEVAGDLCRVTMTTGGQQLVKLGGLPETDWQYAAASGGIVNTTDVAAKAAGAAGVRNYVTGCSLSNNSATATEFVIKDGATVIWRVHCPANMPNTPFTFPTPLRGTAASIINIACITTAAAVYANLQGYQAP